MAKLTIAQAARTIRTSEAVIEELVRRRRVITDSDGLIDSHHLSSVITSNSLLNECRQIRLQQKAEQARIEADSKSPSAMRDRARRLRADAKSLCEAADLIEDDASAVEDQNIIEKALTI